MVLYEASPGVATLNKVGTIDIRTVSGAVDALKLLMSFRQNSYGKIKFGAIMSRMNV